MRIARARKQTANFVGRRDWTKPTPAKYDNTVTKAMIIERLNYATGKTEVITFGQSYGELSMWLNVAFKNTSEFGLSDMLAETFFQGAKIVTKKAEYRLWLKPEKDDEAAFYQSGEIERIYQDVA